MLTGDVEQQLRTLRADSFDACLTDPPYGLSSVETRNMRRATPRASSRAKASGFMGMAWDGCVPGSEVWREVLRVLKPGAPMLAFGGTRTYHRLACAIEDAGFILTDTLCWLHGQGFPKGKSQLKPAWEPITLAWKKGPRVLNIDAARIDGNPWKAHDATGLAKTKFFTDGETPVIHKEPHNQGRWPANLLLDESAAEMLDAQSGVLTSGNNPAKRSSDKHRNVYAGWTGQQCLVRRGTDSGGASRFFYVAKASKRERGEGNHHPTVKPLKLDTELARYLLTLILPPSAGEKRRLLVPFSGSGSEMLGARAAGWEYALGIESESAYVEIAEKRLKAAA